VTKVSNGVIGTYVEASSTAAADSGNQFPLQRSSLLFNLATRPLTVGTYSLKIVIGNDPTVHTILISLR
jgi:hypothetical protein